MPDRLPAERYRPCVAALLQNAAGMILICERRDFAESWQFPQGGIDAGESPREALVRELMEELGLPLEQTEALLERLLRFGRLHKVAANRFFLPDTIADFARIAGVLAAEADGFSAADFNKRTGIGRNLTIQVLEYLDRIGATQRQGELRYVTDQ